MDTNANTADQILITGGSGYLAGFVIAETLAAGYAVRTTLRSPKREAEVREAVGKLAPSTEKLTFATADLTSDEGWGAAAAGCKYVLHVASPFPPKQPKDPDELIVPAREGTLRVLRAAKDAGAERVVVTSSIAAIDRKAGDDPARVLTEEDWADGDHPGNSPYARSKTIAEAAAWDFAEENGGREWLATVNPGAIIGPVLGSDRSFSLQLIERLLGGEPAIPKLGYSVVDVRDIAKLELLAMTTPQAGGNRFIGVSEFAWMADMAKTLRAELGEDAKKVPTRQAPNIFVRLLGIFDGSVKSIVPQLGIKAEYSNQHARDLLGWDPRPVADSVVDCGRSLVAADA